MRLGVLDIGSTSAQLLVVDTDRDTPPLPTHTVKRRTLLGDAFTPDGSIDAAGVERLVRALDGTMAAARDHGVEQLCVVVTAAVRDATNRERVLSRLERETGVRPSYLSGEDEARLGYLAARQWRGDSAGRLMLLDIGGGTMEIAAGSEAEPDYVASLALGARTLTSMFLPSDPPSKKQLRGLHEYVDATLAEVAEQLRDQPEPDTVIGASRTFTQLALLAGAPSQRRGPFARRTLTAADLDDWVPRLACRSSEQRATLRGVSQQRARQILAGAIVARAALDALGIKRVLVCPWALREGLILRHLGVGLPGGKRRRRRGPAVFTETAAS